MKLNIEAKFPYGLKKYNESEINEIGLKVIHTIETSRIEYNTKELNELFNGIKEKCKDRHVWALYGSDDQKNWIPLQVASRNSGNIIDEIRTDFLCMTSFDEKKDLKNWNSYFYNSVMEVRHGFNTKCQKYQKMREMCCYLSIAVLIGEDSLDETMEDSDGIVSKYQKKECDIALKIKPLFWNPAGKEFTYINSL